jgi:hypothetical protein
MVIASNDFSTSLAIYLPVALLGFAAGGSFVSFAYLDPIYVLVAFVGGLEVSLDVRLKEEALAGATGSGAVLAMPQARHRGGMPPLPSVFWFATSTVERDRRNLIVGMGLRAAVKIRGRVTTRRSGARCPIAAGLSASEFDPRLSQHSADGAEPGGDRSLHLPRPVRLTARYSAGVLRSSFL